MALEDYKTKSWAKKYRQSDEEVVKGDSWKKYSKNLESITRGFGRQISVLEIGCGTGRFFCSLKNVSTLWGLDNSEAMLNEARNPVMQHEVEKNIGKINLKKGSIDQLDVVFADGTKFDFIFSIGLLSEYGPTTDISVDFFNNLELLVKVGGIIWLSISDRQEAIENIVNASNLSNSSKIIYSSLEDDKNKKTIVEIRR